MALCPVTSLPYSPCSNETWTPSWYGTFSHVYAFLSWNKRYVKCTTLKFQNKIWLSERYKWWIQCKYDHLEMNNFQIRDVFRSILKSQIESNQWFSYDFVQKRITTREFMNFHICCTWIVHTDFSNRTVPVSHHCSRSDKVIPRIRISIGKSQFENFQIANNCVEGTWRFLLQHIRKVSVVEFSLNTLICDGKWCIDWYWQQRWNELGTRTKFHYC